MALTGVPSILERLRDFPGKETEEARTIPSSPSWSEQPQGTRQEADETEHLPVLPEDVAGTQQRK